MAYENPTEQIMLLRKRLNEEGIPLAGRRIRISKECAKYLSGRFDPERVRQDMVVGSRLFGFDVVEVSGSETAVYLGIWPWPPTCPVTETLPD